MNRVLSTVPVFLVALLLDACLLGACSSSSKKSAAGGDAAAEDSATEVDPGARATNPVLDDGGNPPVDASSCTQYPPLGAPGCSPCHCIGGQAVCTTISCPAADAASAKEPAETSDVAPSSSIDVGGTDAPTPPDAAADVAADLMCKLDEQLTFGNQGGFTPRHDEDTLTVEGVLRIRRTAVGSKTDGPLECHDRLPCVPALTDLRAALADPDVTTALAQPQPPSYGTPIPDIGAFVFRTAAGRGFDLLPGGSAPAGIKKLVQLLEQFHATVLMSASCANLGP